eukprot:CAMPEP_0183349104 /NCGR_PEP_ID=MMETSP0164_2-20130417/13398_1 /TAXON_ID=221442 /ORGANISM="Coccolithus pelagicus ssp braarudi, Strain PLY182g" /LENGTH=147 /DNA_ID=CAMNT_0025520783 /DNA_START=754 /DNA_END=1198 /DNA_ORIENTATION=+
MFQLHAEVSCSHSSEPPRLHCVQARSAEKWHVPATSDSSSVTFTTAGHGMQWSCASASHPAAQAPGCIQLPVDDPHPEEACDTVVEAAALDNSLKQADDKVLCCASQVDKALGIRSECVESKLSEWGHHFLRLRAPHVCPRKQWGCS